MVTLSNRELLVRQGFKYLTRDDAGMWHGTDWSFGAENNPTIHISSPQAKALPDESIKYNRFDSFGA